MVPARETDLTDRPTLRRAGPADGSGSALDPLWITVIALLLSTGSVHADEYFSAFLDDVTTSASGTASLTLTGGALSYRILLRGIDLDGLQTPDPDDDVTTVRFLDSSSGPAVFGLIGPDDDPGPDPLIDAAAGLLTGTWDDDDLEPLSGDLDTLRANDLYLEVETIGSETIIGWDPIGGYVRKAERTHLPLDPLGDDLHPEDLVGFGTLVDYPLDGSEWAVGVLGRALTFDGVDDHATLHDYGHEFPKTQGTVGHWLRPNATGLMVAAYESDFPGSGEESYNGFGLAGDGLEIHTGIFDNEFYALYQDGTGAINVPGSGRRQVTGGEVEVGTWKHVAMTWNLLGELSLYVDCEKVASVNMADGTYAGHYPELYDMQLGEPSEPSGRNWDGLMDEVKILAVELTPEQIRSTFCPVRSLEHPPFFGPTPRPDFGHAAAMDGEWLAVATIGAGVDLFRRTGVQSWTFAQHLDVEARNTGSIGLHGSTLAVGSTSAEVEIYSENVGGPGAWGHVKTLVPTLPGDVNFGWNVQILGDVLGVNSPGFQFSLFSRNEGGGDQWGEVLSSSLGGGGLALALDDQRAFIATGPGILPFESGPGGWSPAHDESFFASSDVRALAVRGDTLLAGVEGEGETGVVEVYRFSDPDAEWRLVQTFTASDLDGGDQFGSQIAWLEDDLVAVAAGWSGASDAWVDHSTLYTFHLGGDDLWHQRTAYLPAHYEALDEDSRNFGVLVGAGDTVLAGTAASFDGNGSLRVFSLPFFFDGFESGDTSAW